MTRYAAFLRAVNVGGRTVKMDALRDIFISLGFSGVDTFIASGNVVFETDESDPAALERRIEEGLSAALGYEVRTFVRSIADLQAIAAHTPFPDAGSEKGDRLYVVFLPGPLNAAGRREVMALRSDVDHLHCAGSEIYW